MNPTTTQAVITHGGPDRRYQLCRCSECGVERECTPHFDFYTRNGAPEDGLLVCENCLVGNLPIVHFEQNPNN